MRKHMENFWTKESQGCNEFYLIFASKYNNVNMLY